MFVACISPKITGIRYTPRRRSRSSSLTLKSSPERVCAYSRNHKRLNEFQTFRTPWRARRIEILISGSPEERHLPSLFAFHFYQRKLLSLCGGEESLFAAGVCKCFLCMRPPFKVRKASRDRRPSNHRPHFPVAARTIPIRDYRPVTVSR